MFDLRTLFFDVAAETLPSSALASSNTQVEQDHEPGFACALPVIR